MVRSRRRAAASREPVDDSLIDDVVSYLTKVRAHEDGPIRLDDLLPRIRSAAVAATPPAKTLRTVSPPQASLRLPGGRRLGGASSTTICYTHGSRAAVALHAKWVPRNPLDSTVGFHVRLSRPGGVAVVEEYPRRPEGRADDEVIDFAVSIDAGSLSWPVSLALGSRDGTLVVVFANQHRGRDIPWVRALPPGRCQVLHELYYGSGMLGGAPHSLSFDDGVGPCRQAPAALSPPLMCIPAVRCLDRWAVEAPISEVGKLLRVLVWADSFSSRGPPHPLPGFSVQPPAGDIAVPEAPSSSQASPAMQFIPVQCAEPGRPRAAVSASALGLLFRPPSPAPSPPPSPATGSSLPPSPAAEPNPTPSPELRSSPAPSTASSNALGFGCAARHRQDAVLCVILADPTSRQARPHPVRGQLLGPPVVGTSRHVADFLPTAVRGASSAVADLARRSRLQGTLVVSTCPACAAARANFDVSRNFVAPWSVGPGLGIPHGAFYFDDYLSGGIADILLLGVGRGVLPFTAAHFDYLRRVPCGLLVVLGLQTAGRMAAALVLLCALAGELVHAVLPTADSAERLACAVDALAAEIRSAVEAALPHLGGAPRSVRVALARPLAREPCGAPTSALVAVSASDPGGPSLSSPEYSVLVSHRSQQSDALVASFGGRSSALFVDATHGLPPDQLLQRGEYGACRDRPARKKRLVLTSERADPLVCPAQTGCSPSTVAHVLGPGGGAAGSCRSILEGLGAAGWPWLPGGE